MVVVGEPIEIDAPEVAASPVARSWPAWALTLRDALAGTDLRSLATFRIAIALIVLADLASRVDSLRVHYTDQGVLPRSIVEATQADGRWSLLLLNGETWFAVLIFALCVLSAIAMALGVQTRLATLVTWALIMSIQFRNPGLLSAADNLLHQLLFWSILLPLGARWSLDARHRQSSPNFYASLASLGLFFQIAFMYWFTAIFKDGNDWRSDGTALGYALNAGHLTTRFGAWLGQFPSILEPMTWFSIGLEIFGPVLLFFPIRNHWFRLIGIAAVISFHLGIGLTMDIGIFPWTSALCMLCFLPTWFWDTALPRIRKLPRRQPTESVETAPDQKPIFALWLESLGSTIAAVSLVLIFFWNLMTVTDFQFPRQAQPVMLSLGLSQQWNMFAPQPPHITQWFIVAGTQGDGTQLNLIPAITRDDFDLAEPLSFERPENIAADWYGTKYWRKYFSFITDKNEAPERNALLAYTCRNWNAQHTGGETIKTITIYTVTERTNLGEDPSDPTLNRTYQYTCRG